MAMTWPFSAKWSGDMRVPYVRSIIKVKIEVGRNILNDADVELVQTFRRGEEEEGTLTWTWIQETVRGRLAEV